MENLNKEITKEQEEMNDLMEAILDIKERIQGLEFDLESDKNELMTMMRKNNKYEIASPTAKAKIIEFNRESLIKDKTLQVIDKFNKGVSKEKINIKDLVKDSSICFVLVKEH